jgi:hypothetical protein
MSNYPIFDDLKGQPVGYATAQAVDRVCSWLDLRLKEIQKDTLEKDELVLNRLQSIEAKLDRLDRLPALPYPTGTYVPPEIPVPGVKVPGNFRGHPYLTEADCLQRDPPAPPELEGK